MTVVIRMKRSGRRNRPCYRISVADARSPRDGRTIESLGFYDPIAPKAEMRLALDVERARHWLQNGAQPSETVRSMFKRSGVYEGLPRPKKRERAGRTTSTKTHRAREAAKGARQEAKTERARTRRREKAQAKKAAAVSQAPAGA